MSANQTAPIIIKRKKVVAGDGHHGGAWKVAYADFVTAMMAFFLLMWLLNATTENQRKGLADYFSPSIPITKVSGGGNGTFWGDDIFAEDTISENGTGASREHPTDMQKAKGEFGLELKSAEADAESGPETESGTSAAEEMLETLNAKGGESMAMLKQMRHVVTRLSDEGLVIDIFESEGEVLFDPETLEPTQLMVNTVTVVSELLQILVNDLSVSGHLASQPLVVANYPIWDISTGRAHSIRETMENSGTDAKRFERVVGFADRKHIDKNPMALRNNRIEITVLRNDL